MSIVGVYPLRFKYEVYSLCAPLVTCDKLDESLSESKGYMLKKISEVKLIMSKTKILNLNDALEPYETPIHKAQYSSC